MPFDYSIVEGQNNRKLTVKLGQDVRKISISGNSVTVKTKEGELYKADAVIVAVPLGVLQAGVIEFNPPLSPDRIQAMNKLGNPVFCLNRSVNLIS